MKPSLDLVKLKELFLDKRIIIDSVTFHIVDIADINKLSDTIKNLFTNYNILSDSALSSMFLNINQPATELSILNLIETEDFDCNIKIDFTIDIENREYYRAELYLNYANGSSIYLYINGIYYTANKSPAEINSFLKFILGKVDFYEKQLEKEGKDIEAINNLVKDKFQLSVFDIYTNSKSARTYTVGITVPNVSMTDIYLKFKKDRLLSFEVDAISSPEAEEFLKHILEYR